MHHHHHYLQPPPAPPPPPPPPFRQAHRHPPHPGLHRLPCAYLAPMHLSAAGTYSHMHNHYMHANGSGAHAGRTSHMLHQLQTMAPRPSAAAYNTRVNASTSTKRHRQESPEERQHRLEYMRKYNQQRRESGAAQRASAECNRRSTKRSREKAVRDELSKLQYSGDIDAMVLVILEEIARRNDRTAENAGKRPEPIRNIVGDVLAGPRDYGLGSSGARAGTSSAAPAAPVAPAPVAPVAPVAPAPAVAAAPPVPAPVPVPAPAPAPVPAPAPAVTVVKISRSDGDHHIVFGKNPVCGGSDGDGMPRFVGFARDASGLEGSLPHHPTTNDPYLPKSIAKLVSTRVKRPDGDCAHRVDIIDGDAEEHLATVVWIRHEDFDETIKSSKGLDDETWPCGAAKDEFRKAYESVRDHEKFGKSGKTSASGEYAEAGYGTGSGSQSTSIKVRNSKGQEEGICLPYLRNPDFAADVEGSLGNCVGLITQYLEEEQPDLLRGLRENGDAIVNRALTYPRPDPSGHLRFAPAVLTNQVATRLVGCPKNGHINALRKLQSQYGGSGLHVDSGDPDSEAGSLTVYICFDDDADPNANRNERKFQYSDLAIFQTKTGGRAAVIETMQPGFVCLVFHHPSRHLHGSVFPKRNRPQPLVPGCEGMKIVCYQSKQILKLADYCHTNQGVFDDYIQKHDEFRIEAQRKGRKNNALCHFAPLARVLQEYLADMDAKRDRGEQISQHEEQRAYHLSCLLWSISHDLDDLRKDEEFDWINTFVDYET